MARVGDPTILRIRTWLVIKNILVSASSSSLLTTPSTRQLRRSWALTLLKSIKLTIVRLNNSSKWPSLKGSSCRPILKTSTTVRTVVTQVRIGATRKEEVSHLTGRPRDPSTILQLLSSILIHRWQPSSIWRRIRLITKLAPTKPRFPGWSRILHNRIKGSCSIRPPTAIRSDKTPTIPSTKDPPNLCRWLAVSMTIWTAVESITDRRWLTQPTKIKMVGVRSWSKWSRRKRMAALASPARGQTRWPTCSCQRTVALSKKWLCLSAWCQYWLWTVLTANRAV